VTINRKLESLASNPVVNSSDMLLSELDTRWMAALILCPRKFLRNKYVADHKSKKLQDFDIAEIFDIPEWVVPLVMDDYYDAAFKKLLPQLALV
jgi:hypothetical protein